MKSMKLSLSAIAAGALLFGAGNTSADLLVYEGFQYGPVGQDLIGNPDDLGGDDAVDATGLSGMWGDGVGTNAEIDILSGSLDSQTTGSIQFTGLTTSGNHAGATTSSNEGSTFRTVTANLSGSSDLYFSYVQRQAQSGNAGTGGFAIVTKPFPNDAEVVDASNGSDTAFEGFGVGANDEARIRAFGWDAGAVSSSAGAFDRVTNTNYLLLGHIDYDDGTAGADIYTLYYITGDVSGSYTKNLIGSMEIDVDQSQLDTIVISRRTQMRFDEIRLATTELEALGIPEPSTLALIGLGGLLIARRRRD